MRLDLTLKYKCVKNNLVSVLISQKLSSDWFWCLNNQQSYNCYNPMYSNIYIRMCVSVWVISLPISLNQIVGY